MIDKYHKRFWPLVLALAFAWAMVFVGHSFAKGGDIQGRRVALIVGNSKYKSVYSLKNAVSDSASVSAVLSRLGFEVIEVSDVTKADFETALDKFSAAAEDAEAAVFYYSGHGFQLGGSNFLVPTDAKLNDRKTILKETLRLNDVIKAVQDRNRQTLIFLDACRNNPLPESVRDKSMIDGLAQLEAGTGTFVAFATQPGNITRDGAGDHSPFAAALIEHMETPGISISDMMIRVRNSVEVATLQTQTPWDQSSLRTQFYFSPEEEVSADLTDEDKALLLSLPPALRKKFAVQFGIKFSDDGVIVTKTVQIKRRFSISAGGNDTPEAPVAIKKPVIKGRFKIAAGGSNDDVVVASLEPGNKKPAKPVLAPIDDDLASNDSTFIPLPNFRPGVGRVEKDPDQLVASLSPSETKPEIAQRFDPKTEPEIVAEPAAPAAKTLPEVTTKPENVPVIKKAVTAPVAEKFKAAPVVEKTETAPVVKKVTKTPDSPKVSAPKVFVPEQLKPKTTTAAPLVAEKFSAPETTAKPKAKKPRVIAITNPGLANSLTVAKAKVEKDVQVAINSSSRNSSRVKSSTSRSSLKPIAVLPTRLVGKEVIQEKPADEQSKPEKDLQIAMLEPESKNTAVRSVEITPKVEKQETTSLGIQDESEVAKVAPVGLEDAKKTGQQLSKEDDVKVASLDNNSTANNSQSDENITPAIQPTITPPSHALEVQAELARLGCYRSKVDGLWGSYSARALLRYYGNKKIAPSILEPTAEMLTMLRSDEVVVCKRTITKKPRRKVITKKSDKNSKSARKKKGKRIRIRKSKTVRKKALKKSLSKGVFR